MAKDTLKNDVDCSRKPTYIDLCAGAVGLSEGVKRTIGDMQPLAFVEIETYAAANLVAKMEAGLLAPAPVWTNLKTFPGLFFRGKVDILMAGYPCQPFSAAGQRQGAEDPRHLWPYVARAINDVRPGVVYLENVEGHISLGLREVIADLVTLGYRVANDRGEPTFGIFSASETGASHQRKRVFILAVDDTAWNDRTRQEWQGRLGRGVCETGNELADAGNGQLQEPGRGSQERNGFRSTIAIVADSENDNGRGRKCGTQEGTRARQCWRRGSPSCCSELADSNSPGCRTGRLEQCQSCDAEQCCDQDVAHTNSSRHENRSVQCQQIRDTGANDLRPKVAGPGTEFRDPIPGPNDPRWPEIVERYPYIAPAIKPGFCGSFAGLAVVLDRHRVDRLRLGGNGVHRATAAKAFRTLIERITS